MRKFLVFPDRTTYELSPITFEEFVKTELWLNSTEEYGAFLRLNNLHLITDLVYYTLTFEYIK